jgi:predicted NodU family carbamoyl transferase
MIADMLANDLIVGWVNGRYEIGPRALGNRSILAAPFLEGTRVRLNEIKQREQFRPNAPVCLEEEAARWFDCDHASPFMLYTHRVRTDALAAVTHVNRTVPYSDGVICEQSKFVSVTCSIPGTYWIRRLM